MSRENSCCLWISELYVCACVRCLGGLVAGTMRAICWQLDLDKHIPVGYIHNTVSILHNIPSQYAIWLEVVTGGSKSLKLSST